MAESPTQRTIRYLRNQGRRCGIVEKFNAHAGPHGIRQDLFGIIDVIALDPEQGVVGVQCCAGSGFAAHYRKIAEECADASLEWLSTPGTRLELHAWRKVKLRRGGKAERWMPRIHVFTRKDFSDPFDKMRETASDLHKEIPEDFGEPRPINSEGELI